MRMISLADRDGVQEGQIDTALGEFAAERLADAKSVLILPPDYTRFQSMAGMLTSKLYKILKGRCGVDIMPAVGSHMPMSERHRVKMFGADIPAERFIYHDWLRDTVPLGTVPAEFVAEVSEGCYREEIAVEVNRRIVSGEYDCILSAGQVVPHEVVGMANYSKNIFVGCGGRRMIDKTHLLGALYGIERVMGEDRTPVRRVFDYAHERFLSGSGSSMETATPPVFDYAHDKFLSGRGSSMETANPPVFDYAHERFLSGSGSSTETANLPVLENARKKLAAGIPIVFLQTVTSEREGKLRMNGLFIGEGRAPYEAACALSRETNIVKTGRAAAKVVAWLDPDEFTTTWVANKGIYRTRKMIADGGELIMLAPGVERLGENDELDSNLRKYGYKGRDYILRCMEEGRDIIPMAAAHLIHGSSDGRFTITYASRMTRAQTEEIGYRYGELSTLTKRYAPDRLADGWNNVGGEEIYFVRNPALGLWEV